MFNDDAVDDDQSQRQMYNDSCAQAGRGGLTVRSVSLGKEDLRVLVLPNNESIFLVTPVNEN
jgi:hypothetical protein